MPETTPETANQLGDISRDLQNLASGTPDGPKGSRRRHFHYAQDTDNGQACGRGARAAAWSGADRQELQARAGDAVAQHCWVTVAARQLSEKQVDSLENEMKQQLMALG
jgi:hypothetical protein